MSQGPVGRSVLAAECTGKMDDITSDGQCMINSHLSIIFPCHGSQEKIDKHR